MSAVLPSSSWLLRHGSRDARRGIRHCDRLSGGFAVFAPGFQSVRSRRNILDRKSTVITGQGEVRRGNNYNVGYHVGMKIAEGLCRTKVVELERLLLARRHNRQIMPESLVAVDRWPIDVVSDLVAVEKIHCGSPQDDYGVRYELQVPLVNRYMLDGRIEFLARNGIDVENNVFG